MAYINPYLTFNGNCREAMTFYKDCLGGELTLQTVKDSPMADQWPTQVQDHILHATLMNGALVLLASDMAAPEGQVDGNTVSLALTCASREELDNFFSNLSNGGQVLHAPHDFFAGTIGSLRDKYGKYWQLYYSKDLNIR